MGRPVPDAIANAPRLDPWLELYRVGFLDLTSCRSIGMVIGPISTLSILDYCAHFGIEGEQREDFVWLMQNLDAKYLEWTRTKDGKPARPSEKNGNTRRRR